MRPVISPSMMVGASSVFWVRDRMPLIPSPVKDTTLRAWKGEREEEGERREKGERGGRDESESGTG